MSQLRRRIAAVVGALVLAVGVVSSATLSVAVPDDGPSSNTPGTSSNVWPSKVTHGEKVNFTVSGFPPGETLYIKIDDGAYCDQAAIHGACVVATQPIKRDGTATGSVYIAEDIPTGKNHWLRFLASAPAQNGDGVLGYTHRGAPSFEVTAPAAAQPSPNEPAPTKAKDKKKNSKSETKPKKSQKKTSKKSSPKKQEQPLEQQPQKTSKPSATAPTDSAQGNEASSKDAADQDSNQQSKDQSTSTSKGEKSDTDPAEQAEDNTNEAAATEDSGLPWDPDSPAATSDLTPVDPDVIRAQPAGDAQTSGLGVGTWVAAVGGGSIIVAAAGATLLFVRRRRL